LSPLAKMLGGRVPPSTPGLLSLTSGSIKNKRTEFDNRRLTLCLTNVGGGGTKALASPLAKKLGGRIPLGFTPMSRSWPLVLLSSYQQKTIKLLSSLYLGIYLRYLLIDSFYTQIDELQDVLNIVGQCRKICSDLAEYQDMSGGQNEDKSAVLLALYHFEALAKLTRYTNRTEPQSLQDLFQEICRLQQSDAKTFETVAGTTSCLQTFCFE